MKSKKIMAVLILTSILTSACSVQGQGTSPQSNATTAVTVAGNTGTSGTTSPAESATTKPAAAKPPATKPPATKPPETRPPVVRSFE